MSGPKTSNYSISAEQSKINAERRRIRLEKQKKNVLLRQSVSEVKAVVVKLEDELALYKRIVAETGKSRSLVKQFDIAINQAIQMLNEFALISPQSELNTLDSALERLQEIKHTVTKDKKKISSEIKSLKNEIDESVSEGFNISFIKIEEEIGITDISVYATKIDAALAEVEGMHLSESLKRRFDILRQKAAEIESIDFIENYYIMSVIPFVKDCRTYNSLYLEYGALFNELYLDYQILADELSVPKRLFDFSVDNIEELKRVIYDMQAILQRKEEQEYISECVDKAMQEMGYKIIGDREVVRKDGRRFTNELYLFDEGTAVNVTYSDEGQITMELGGLDNQDRIPSDAECQSLVEDMTSFCEDYLIIEEKLKQMGILTHRVSILPPDEQFAQIINTSDYHMTKVVSNFVDKGVRKMPLVQSYMRKEE